MSDAQPRSAAELVAEAKGRVQNLSPEQVAADTLQRMGNVRVAHLDRGIKAWKEGGLPVEDVAPSGH